MLKSLSLKKMIHGEQYVLNEKNPKKYPSGI